MTKLVHLLFLMLCMAMLVGFTSSANAAEIKVLSDGPLEPALTKVAETFRRESNHTLTFEYGLSPVIHKKVLDGEVALFSRTSSTSW